MRALPAILGSLTVPVVYAIMKESGYSTIIATFSAILILFGELYCVVWMCVVVLMCWVG